MVLISSIQCYRQYSVSTVAVIFNLCAGIAARGSGEVMFSPRLVSNHNSQGR